MRILGNKIKISGRFYRKQQYRIDICLFPTQMRHRIGDVFEKHESKIYKRAREHSLLGYIDGDFFIQKLQAYRKTPSR